MDIFLYFNHYGGLCHFLLFFWYERLFFATICIRKLLTYIALKISLLFYGFRCRVIWMRNSPNKNSSENLKWATYKWNKYQYQYQCLHVFFLLIYCLSFASCLTQLADKCKRIYFWRKVSQVKIVFIVILSAVILSNTRFFYFFI